MAGYLSRSCDHSRIRDWSRMRGSVGGWRHGHSGSQLRKMPYDRAANLTFVCPQLTLPHATAKELWKMRRESFIWRSRNRVTLGKFDGQPVITCGEVVIITKLCLISSYNRGGGTTVLL